VLYQNLIAVHWFKIFRSETFSVLETPVPLSAVAFLRKRKKRLLPPIGATKKLVDF